MLTKKIALAAGALTLAAGGVAAAAGSPPEEAEKGLTTAEAQVGTDLPATKDAHPGGPEEEGTEDQETDELETEELEVAEEDDLSDGPTDNHGADVSAVAQSDEHEGREHGEAVSTVARDNHGAETSAAARAGAADDAEDDTDDGGAADAAKARR